MQVANTPVLRGSFPKSGPITPMVSYSGDQTDTVKFGHSHHETPEKTKKPWKLIIWGLADVMLLGGSVFTADILVPDPDHPSEEVAKDEEHSSGKTERAFKVSGLATGIHLLSHVGLAGGWFLYGRHRGAKGLDNHNTNYQDFQQYAEKMAKQGGQFQVIALGDGEFKIVKAGSAEVKSDVPTPASSLEGTVPATLSEPKTETPGA